MSSHITGRCLCGKIKYELTGDAVKPIYNTVCYCLNCRRITGSALYTASICLKDVRSPHAQYAACVPGCCVTCADDAPHMQGFKVTEGEEHQKTYWDTNTDSGTTLKRVFCSECGTKLFAYTPLWDEIVSVAAGTLDDFDAWKPDTEQYCIHRADWVEEMKGVASERRFQTSVKGSIDR